MKIETKYNLSQEVWFIEGDKIIGDTILQIEFTKTAIEESTVYYFSERTGIKNGGYYGSYTRRRLENVCFATKEELINSLK